MAQAPVFIRSERDAKRYLSANGLVGVKLGTPRSELTRRALRRLCHRLWGGPLTDTVPLAAGDPRAEALKEAGEEPVLQAYMWGSVPAEWQSSFAELWALLECEGRPRLIAVFEKPDLPAYRLEAATLIGRELTPCDLYLLPEQSLDWFFGMSHEQQVGPYLYRAKRPT